MLLLNILLHCHLEVCCHSNHAMHASLSARELCKCCNDRGVVDVLRDHLLLYDCSADSKGNREHR